MANYAQNNIYRKQMQQLGLNTKQYAKLIEIPYEVVKDFIYDKEGRYSMEIKNLLRKNMFNKHQEIENDYDNAKIKALEMKKENVDYVEWYENEYHFDVLKDTLKDIKTIIDFENKYHITVRGIKASHWFYSCLTSKMNYKKRNISESTLSEFAEQLYDIIVNKNIEQYRETNSDYSADDLFYINWFDSYDIEKFLSETNHTKHDLSKMMGIGYSTICLMCQKKYRSIKRIKQLYNIVKKYEKETLRNDIRQAQINGETEKIEELKKEHYVMKTNYLGFKEPIKIEPVVDTDENANDIVLRKLLINRLTEEEKELIRIFGGKIC